MVVVGLFEERIEVISGHRFNCDTGLRIYSRNIDTDLNGSNLDWRLDCREVHDKKLSESRAPVGVACREEGRCRARGRQFVRLSLTPRMPCVS